jgi:hypothetical protein
MLIGNTKIGGIGSLFIKNTYDADALNYLTAVEAADGQTLESPVKAAINTFVVGCKADGIWDSIVTSCIMAGARTLAGAIIPLKGNAPTNNNFVSGDYSRTLGLLGDSSIKYLDTGYNNNDTTNFPQNDSHMSCYVSASQTDTTGTLIGTTNAFGGRFSLHYTTATQIATRNRSSSASSISLAPIGFQGNTRNNSANFSRRFTTVDGISDNTTTASSSTPSNELLGVFAAGDGTNFSAARISFYSIGKSVSISNLDTRVTTLVNAIASALT